MKFIDRNGNSHKNIFTYLLSNFGIKIHNYKNNISEDNHISKESNGKKEIKIDWDSNKIKLVDKNGNIIDESDIDPTLTTVINRINTNIKDDNIEESVKFIENVLSNPNTHKSINKYINFNNKFNNLNNINNLKDLNKNTMIYNNSDTINSKNNKSIINKLIKKIFK